MLSIHTTLHKDLPTLPAIHMLTPLTSELDSDMQSGEEHIPQAFGVFTTLKAARDKIWFSLEECSYSHMALPSDILCYVLIPSTLSKLWKVGT